MRIYIITGLLIFVYAFLSCSALPWTQDYLKFAKGDFTILSPSKFLLKELEREPNCNELRAMWRFSMVKSRNTEITNEIPTYRDPFAYNIWEPHAKSRHPQNGVLKTGTDLQGSNNHIYGKIVHSVPRDKYVAQPKENDRRFDVMGKFLTSPDKAITPRRKNAEAYRLPNGAVYLKKIPALTDSFRRLKATVRAQRAKEMNEQKLADSRGVLKDVHGLTSLGHNPSLAYFHHGNGSFSGRPNYLSSKSLHFISNPYASLHGPSKFYDNVLSDHYIADDGYNHRYVGPVRLNLQYFPDQSLPISMPSRF